MWKLNLNRSAWSYVNISFLYTFFVCIGMPFMIGGLTQEDLYLYIYGYGVLYAIAYYLAFSIAVPILLFLYKKILFLGPYWGTLLILVLNALMIMIGYWYFIRLLPPPEEIGLIKMYVETCSAPLLLLLFFIQNEGLNGSKKNT